MSANLHFLEKVTVAPGIVPVNLATAANTGKRFDMSKFGRVAVIVFKGAGNAAEDPTITLMQHDAASNGNSKALNFTEIRHKIGTLASVAQFTTETQAAGNTWTKQTFGDGEAIVVIDVKAEDLDVNNGYRYISANIADVGTNSQIGCVLYAGHEPRYGGDSANRHFLEKYEIVAGFAPVDMSSGSGPTSDVVNIKNYGRIAAVLFAGVGQASNDTTITGKQSTGVAGTPADLNLGRVDILQAVDIDDAEWTTSADNDKDYSNDTSGESQLIWAVDVKAEDLDLDNKRDSVAVTVNDHGATKLGGLLYFLHEPRYATTPMPGAITN